MNTYASFRLPFSAPINAQVRRHFGFKLGRHMALLCQLGESTSRTTTASSGVGNVRSSSHIASALATKFAAYLPLTGGACRDVSCSIFQLLLNFSLLLLFLPFLLFLLSSLSFFFIFFFFSFFFFFKCLSLQRHVDGCATAASESRTFHSVTVAQWLG